jgi:hypothetical protein
MAALSFGMLVGLIELADHGLDICMHGRDPQGRLARKMPDVPNGCATRSPWASRRKTGKGL